jgi:hypothetical protein
MPLTDEQRLERKRGKARERQKAFRHKMLKSNESEAYRARRREQDNKSKKKKREEAKTVTIAKHGNNEATSEMVAEEAMSILAAAATARASAEGGSVPSSAGVPAVAATLVMDRGNRSAADRIREITELRESGLVTNEQFEKKRQEIIDSI